MKVVSRPRELQEIVEDHRLQGKRIGVVPTMGFLHEGHLSLIRLAGQHTDIVITTIFVNPTQFAPNEDLASYPRDAERDRGLAEAAGTAILFMPAVGDMYPAGYATYIEVEGISGILEGKFRPTHFRGVTTVVAKLLLITKPHVAVFGQKDAQQAVLIKRMVKDLNFDVEVRIGPTVREKDGLAMSSRNAYLTPEERAQSTVLYRSLQAAAQIAAGGERRCSFIRSEMAKMIAEVPSAQTDYISIAHPETLEELSMLQSGNSALISLAVRIGKTRLIDNTIISAP